MYPMVIQIYPCFRQFYQGSVFICLNVLLQEFSVGDYCGSICPPLSGESIIVYMAEHLKIFQFLFYFSVLICIIMVTL